MEENSHQYIRDNDVDANMKFVYEPHAEQKPKLDDLGWRHPGHGRKHEPVSIKYRAINGIDHFRTCERRVGRREIF